MYRSHNHQLHIAIPGDLHSVDELFPENQNIIESCHLVSVSFNQASLSDRGRLETVPAQLVYSCMMTRSVSGGENRFTKAQHIRKECFFFFPFCCDKNSNIGNDYVSRLIKYTIFLQLRIRFNMSTSSTTYFSESNKKGEVSELKKSLQSVEVQRDASQYKKVIQKVISSMTLGMDLSSLFMDMIKVKQSRIQIDILQ